jgi:hypothetical protein
MAYTRADFDAAIAAEISNYPTAAQFYQAGDPRLLAQLGAMATMLTMVSQQLDVASMEPFIKARDTTVLADATLKGILPFARPARVTLTVQNVDTVNPLTISIGRNLIGEQGRIYATETGAVIAPGGTATITARQRTTRTFSHTVAGSVPFYPVQITPPDDGELEISGVLVSVAGVSYPYTPEFSNLAANEAGFVLETDEQRRLFAKFGWKDTFGVQPSNGTVIDFIIEETYGVSSLSAGQVFTFESATLPADQTAKLTLASVVFPGADPVDIQTMREWAQYPSTYDASAVYLGNFDFLVRRNLPNIRFLSVWNEQIEESVRGANVRNINTLFIAATMDGTTDAWVQGQISQIIGDADDSYRIQYVPIVEVPVPVTVSAQVSVVHDPDDVAAKIRAVLLGLYGRDSAAVKSGMMLPNYKRIYDALTGANGIPALQDAASDVQIVIPAPNPAVMPEHFRYMTLASMTINVTQSTYNTGLFSH